MHSARYRFSNSVCLSAVGPSHTLIMCWNNWTSSNRQQPKDCSSLTPKHLIKFQCCRRSPQWKSPIQAGWQNRRFLISLDFCDYDVIPLKICVHPPRWSASVRWRSVTAVSTTMFDRRKFVYNANLEARSYLINWYSKIYVFSKWNNCYSAHWKVVGWILCIHIWWTKSGFLV